MAEDKNPAIAIRPASKEDAGGIVRTYIESAEHHARLDPERYSVPAAELILARYRERADGEGVTFVAELNDEIVGFVDARIERSADAMHREMSYCSVAEIAVSSRHQSQGIGARLLQAVEDWGRIQGATFASLEYHVANTRAAEFYQRRMGYRAAAITAIKRL